MNLICKDCHTELDACQCTETTVDPSKIQIIASIEARIQTEYQKHHRSLPHNWARIAAQKIYSTHFNYESNNPRT
jgi:hypothetical protein